MKEIQHLHLGALRKSEREKRTKLTTTRSWTIFTVWIHCASEKHVDQLVLRTPSFPWVTLKTIAKENILTLKEDAALLEHLV